MLCTHTLILTLCIVLRLKAKINVIFMSASICVIYLNYVLFAAAADVYSEYDDYMQVNAKVHFFRTQTHTAHTHAWNGSGSNSGDMLSM